MDDETDTVHGLVEDRQLVRWFTEHVGTFTLDQQSEFSWSFCVEGLRACASHRRAFLAALGTHLHSLYCISPPSRFVLFG